MAGALVTCAAGGIGAVIARKLASNGYGVVVTDLHGTGTEAIAQELRETAPVAVGYQLDVTDRSTVETV